MTTVMSSQAWHMLMAHFCHECMSPIGAVQNAIELLEDSDQLDHEILGLLKASNDKLSVRLQYYRQAYGTARPDSESSISAKLPQLVNDFFALQKVIITPNPCTELWHTYQQSMQQRVLLNMMITIASCALIGGQLSIVSSSDTVSFTLEAQRINVPDLLITLLDQGVQSIQDTDLSPQTIQDYYSFILLNHLPGQVKFSKLSDTKLEFNLQI